MYTEIKDEEWNRKWHNDDSAERDVIFIVDDVPRHRDQYLKLFHPPQWHIECFDTIRDVERALDTKTVEPVVILVNGAIICGAELTFKRTLEEKTDAPIVVLEYSKIKEAEMLYYLHAGIDDVSDWPLLEGDSGKVRQRLRGVINLM